MIPDPEKGILCRSCTQRDLCPFYFKVTEASKECPNCSRPLSKLAGSLAHSGVGPGKSNAPQAATVGQLRQQVARKARKNKPCKECKQTKEHEPRQRSCIDCHAKKSKKTVAQAIAPPASTPPATSCTLSQRTTAPAQRALPTKRALPPPETLVHARTRNRQHPDHALALALHKQLNPRDGAESSEDESSQSSSAQETDQDDENSYCSD